MLVAYGWNESVRFHEWRLSLVPALACQPPQDNMAAVGRWVDGQLVPPRYGLIHDSDGFSTVFPRWLGLAF